MEAPVVGAACLHVVFLEKRGVGGEQGKRGGREGMERQGREGGGENGETEKRKGGGEGEMSKSQGPKGTKPSMNGGVYS